VTDLYDSPPAPGHAGRTERAALGAAPPDPAATLRGRMLVNVGPTCFRWAETNESVIGDGLVLSGKGSAAKLGELRAVYRDRILLADPAHYTDYTATKDAPFYSGEQGSLFSTGLDSAAAALQEARTEQLGRGANLVVSPSGYFRAEAARALRNAAAAVADFADPRVAFAAPLHFVWFTGERIAQTISILSAVPGLKLVMIAGQMDPMANPIVANVRRLLAEVPGVALLRTDIAAVGALAYCAEFTSFGVISSQRHLTPPKEPVQTGKRKSGGPKSPSVLYPELMSFYLGETIADRHGADSAPTCGCDACQGARLDRFTTKAQGLAAEAMAHNVAIMTQWSKELRTQHAQADPRTWWTQRCAAAADRTRQLNAELKQTTGTSFKPCPQLQQWATPDSAQSSPQP
jgi:hypothetical protein